MKYSWEKQWWYLDLYLLDVKLWEKLHKKKYLLKVCLGHYKAMINDPNWKKKPEERKQEIDFIMLMVDMINILLKFGFAPQWWCQSVTVMIEKDPGNPRIEHFWVIHFFEANYNFCLKLLWGHQLVYHGEDNNCFRYQSLDHVLITRQLMWYIRKPSHMISPT